MISETKLIKIFDWIPGFKKFLKADQTQIKQISLRSFHQKFKSALGNPLVILQHNKQL